mmetsp:Transcript_12528/g.24427  ORF Transcript_12528/g.24427 Transcript_12528/m.24427 type:complete len:80 (-) Transcript_12528:50-289(-)
MSCESTPSQMSVRRGEVRSKPGYVSAASQTDLLTSYYVKMLHFHHRFLGCLAFLVGLADISSLSLLGSTFQQLIACRNP